MSKAVEVPKASREGRAWLWWAVVRQTNLAVGMLCGTVPLVITVPDVVFCDSLFAAKPFPSQ